MKQKKESLESNMPQNNVEKIIEEFKSKFGEHEYHECPAQVNCGECTCAREKQCEFIESKINQVRSQTLAEVEEKIEGMKFVLDFPIENDEDELMWRERKEQIAEMNRLLDRVILSLKQKSEENK